MSAVWSPEISEICFFGNLHIPLNDNNDEDEISKQLSLTKKRKLTSSIVENNNEDVSYNNVATQKDMPTYKRCRRFSDNFSLTQNDVLINVNNKENGTAQAKEIYQTIDDMHHMILQNIEKKFHSFTKKLNQLIPHTLHQNLESYREKDEVFPSQVMYEDKNLLETRGRDIYDFARKTLKILFTPEELSTSILPPARNHLARPALDSERFDTFHEAVRVKYKISALHYDNCYGKLIRPRMCDFLIDERKRYAKVLKSQSRNNEEQTQNMD